MIIPQKLKKGDEIRVIAPARSLSIVSEDVKKRAIETLEQMGFIVTFSKNCNERDILNSSSVESRISDLHEAFLDKNVKAILTAIGGFSSNQMLKKIEYEIIKNNPKVLCGFSDITALANAITVKTGIVTYLGLHFSSFGKQPEKEYNIKYFEKCLLEDTSFLVHPSKTWTDEKIQYKNSGIVILQNPKNNQPCSVEGEIVGGNLCTLNLLQGTEFMPDLENKILFLEDDYEVQPENFERDLQSLLHQKNGDKVRALVIGRFQTASNMTMEKLKYLVETKPELANIPVIANADFGHTAPLFTFPIGGSAKIIITDGMKLEIITH